MADIQVSRRQFLRATASVAITSCVGIPLSQAADQVPFQRRRRDR